ncbi:MAG TPA: AMP-binding protein, partial [Clostridia bacterium]|nr:AMP-binding protein [Clostridia bacterium]
MIHLPLGEKAAIVPIDYNASSGAMKEKFELFHVDYIITDEPEGVQVKTATDAGLGVITYSLQGERGDIHIDLKLVLKPSDSDRGATVKRKHHLFIMPTSGTTSTPKIVPLNYRAIQSAVEEIGERYKVGPGDVFLTPVSLSKIASMTLFRMFGLGITFIVVDSFVPADFFRMAGEYKINLFAGMPAAYEAMVRYIKENGITIEEGDFKVIEVFGAPLSRQLKESLENTLKAMVSQNYGMTETQHITSTLGAHKGYRDGSVGVMRLNESMISGQGEILVRGPGVFDGYETQEGIDMDCFSDGWFHTGDIGYFDEDGYLFITSRIKEMINKGGEKISPYEIEGKILKNSRIKSAAVFPFTDRAGNEDAGAVVVLNDKGTMTLQELRSFLKDKVKDYHMPSVLFCVDEIPIGENQKIIRKRLYELLVELYPDKLDDGMEKKERRQKKTRMQKTVMNIWKRALGVRHLNMNSVFTEIGGDSVSGGLILSGIEDRMGIRVPVDVLFNGGTIRKMAEYISIPDIGHGKYHFLHPLKNSGTKKPLFCAHSGEGAAVTYNHIAKYMEPERPVIGIITGRNVNLPEDFTELAARYAEEIMKLQPEGPYNLCGHCLGGVLAFAIAERIEKAGGKIGMLAMFDSVAHNHGNKTTTKNERYVRSLPMLMKRLLKIANEQLKGKRFRMVFYLVGKKTRGAYNLIRTKFSQMFYNKGVTTDNALFKKLGSGTGKLLYSYTRYKPGQLKCIIDFYQASVGDLAVPENPGYWEKHAGKLILHKIDCYHNEL